MMAGDQRDPDAAGPPSKRLTPARIVLLVVGLLLGLLVLKVVLILKGRPTISVDYTAQLNRISKPAGYDPNNDAAFDYKKAAEVFTRMPPELFSSSGWAFRQANLDPAELEKVNKWVIANREALTYLKRGSTKPYLWLKVSTGDKVWYEPAIDLLRVREMGLLLSWHARLELEQARPDVALHDSIAGYRLARHFAGQKWYVQNVGRALEALTVAQISYILANTQLDSGSLQSLQQQLEQQISQKPEPDFEGVKLFMLDAVQRICTDNGRGNGHIAPSDAARQLVRSYLQYREPPARQNLPGALRRYAELARREEPSDFAVNTKIVSMAMFGPDRKEMVKSIQDYCEYLKKLRARTPWQLRQKGIQPVKELRDKMGCELLRHVCGPVYTVFIEMWQRQQVQDVALITVIAIMRYKADNDRFPQVLDELVTAGYLKQLPMDPYSSGPLVYASFGGDFTLYSLGADFDDDGGVPSNWGRGGGDQVFWPVERRQPNQEPEQGATEKTKSSTDEAVRSPDSTLKLQEKTHVLFAEVEDAKNRLTTRDIFISSLSPFDRSARLKTDKYVSEAEFLEHVGKQVRPWTADEKRRMRAVFQSVANKLVRFKLSLPEKILLIKTTGEEEGCATYTRSGAIVLPQARVDEEHASLEHVIIHELFHILTANDPNLKEALYGIIHFRKCNEISFPDNLRQTRITNPDAPRNDHYVEVEYDGRLIQVVPVIYSSAARYDVKEGGDLFHYLTFRLLAIEESEGRWNYRRGGGDQPMLLQPEEVPDYFDKIGRNTGYIIHPEEILAENFVLVVRGLKDVESRWLVEEMEKVLQRYCPSEVLKQ